MITALHIIDRLPHWREAQPGDMWRIDRWDQPDRECWAILLPNRTVWKTTDRAGGTGERWEVTGTPPCITVNPSIWDQDPENGWHGWIRNGELVPC